MVSRKKQIRRTLTLVFASFLVTLSLSTQELATAAHDSSSSEKEENSKTDPQKKPRSHHSANKKLNKRKKLLPKPKPIEPPPVSTPDAFQDRRDPRDNEDAKSWEFNYLDEQ